MDGLSDGRVTLTPANLVNAVISSSSIAKITSLVVLVLYFCSYSQGILDHLCIIPGYVLPPNMWIWTLVTHNFIQPHLILLVVDILVILFTGKLLEPLWGPIHLALFFLITTCSSAFLTSFVYMIAYYITGNTDYLFETRICGLAAYTGGFCTAMKQLMPDEVLVSLPTGKFQVKHTPLSALLLVTVLALAGVLGGSYPYHLGFGILASWIYLRFYQKHGNGNKGDMAEEFTFASFFPPPLELPVAILSNTIFSLLIRMKLCRKPQRKYDVSSPATITVTLPGTDPADAERRRQLAIKALNERLSKASEETSWPGLEDDDDDTFGDEKNTTPDVLVVPTSAAGATPHSHEPSGDHAGSPATTSVHSTRAS